MGKLFGTNGVRGIVNQDMNLRLVSELAMAIGTYMQGKIIVGTDTRVSNQMLKHAVFSGLLSSGCDVVDMNIAPTPAVQYAVKCANVNGGVIITASHNPPEFNGIKCIDVNGLETSHVDEEKIEAIYFSKRFKLAKWDEVGKVEVDQILINSYIEAIIKQVDVPLLKKSRLKVVVDCANGAGCSVTPYLLRKLGCEVITLNAQPDGTFPGHNSEPVEENLSDLMKMVRSCNADVGVAHDGDADRAIFIDENGRYIYGDKTLALVAKEMVKENKGGIVVTPISSSSCIEDVVKENGGKVEYTQVGSPIVARKMIETKAIFGGEENGGLIFPKHQYCRDAAMAAAKILEIIAKKGKKISELISEIPKYELRKIKTYCANEKKDEVIKKLIEKMKDKKIETMDGIKIFFDEGWVLIRPSGTEPMYRIFAETKEKEAAERLVNEHKKIVEDIIKEL